MRNIVIVLVLFLVLFFSCTPKKAPDWSGFPKLYLTGQDTIIKDSCSLYDKTTVTGFTCEGRPYAKEKMIPRAYISGHHVTTQGQELSKDSLVSLLKQAGRGNLIPERENIGYNIPWDILGWIGLVIIGLLLLWLLLWLLREFLNWFNKSRNNSQNNQGVLKDSQTGRQAYTGPAEQIAANPVQSNPEPKGTWVPASYMLIPSGSVVVPHNGIYLGIRNEKEVLMAEIIPQNQTSITETIPPVTNTEQKPKTNI